MTATLDLVERALDLGTAEIILELAAPGGAERMAERLFAADSTAEAEFGGDVALLAAYLRSRAQPQRRDAARALREPDRAPRLSLMPTPAAQMHHLSASAPSPAPTAGCQPAVAAPAPPPPRSSPALLGQVPAPGSAPVPAPAPPPSEMPLEEVAERLGVRLHLLPKTRKVRGELAKLGMLAHLDDPNSWSIDARAVERLAVDPPAITQLILSLSHALPQLCHVGGGGVHRA